MKRACCSPSHFLMFGIVKNFHDLDGNMVDHLIKKMLNFTFVFNSLSPRLTWITASAFPPIKSAFFKFLAKKIKILNTTTINFLHDSKIRKNLPALHNGHDQGLTRLLKVELVGDAWNALDLPVSLLLLIIVGAGGNSISDTLWTFAQVALMIGKASAGETDLLKCVKLKVGYKFKCFFAPAWAGQVPCPRFATLLLHFLSVPAFQLVGLQKHRDQHYDAIQPASMLASWLLVIEGKTRE